MHVSGRAYAGFSPTPGWEWWLADVVNGSCRAAVPVFVMISGALMTARDGDPVMFYRKKALRFLPVILAWTALYFIFDVVVLGLSVTEVALLFVSRGYVYLHLWYLSMYVVLLGLIPYLAKLRFSLPCPARDWRILAGLGVAFLSVEWAFHLLSRVSGGELFPWMKNFVIYLPCFLLGAWLSTSENRSRRGLCALLLAVVLVLSWTANFLSCRFLGIVEDSFPLSNQSPLVMAAAILVFLLVRTGAKALEESPQWLSVNAQASLGIYLFHPLVIWAITRGQRGTGFDFLSGGWMLATAVVVYGVSFAAVMILRRFALGRMIC